MLSVDYSHCLTDSIGHERGLAEQELFGLQPRLQEAHANVKRLTTSGRVGFMDLPRQTEEAKAILAFARRARTTFGTLVVLGIGGSALGNIAIQQALRPLYWNLLDRKRRRGWLRLFVLDNVDPRWAAELLGILNVKKTLFNVISKSGTTAECLAGYFFFRGALARKVGARNVPRHLIFTTDAQKGYLREVATREHIRTFPIPPNVGGRFSVLSPVGLVSAALTGVDILDLLSGAQAMARRCQSASMRENPSLAYAALQHLFYQRGVHLSVAMPYSQNLWGVADWYRQLWAESLGKKLDKDGNTVNAGPTPIKALGVTDQHSQAQLYMEGPYDKVITFLSIQDFGRKTVIPAVDPSHYLGGLSFNELIKAEEQGTRAALTKAQRPNLTVSLPELSAFTLGEIFFFFECAVSYMGELMHVNAFDQPGVELAKIYTYALMGRSGYDAQRAELEQLRKQESQAQPMI